MNEFRNEFCRPPLSWYNSDAQHFIRIAKDLNSQSDSPVEINEPLMELFSNVCIGDLSPMAAAIGGIVAQEVLKACTGKFMPIMQWFYFDARECLLQDTSGLKLTHDTDQPVNVGSRYEGQINVFGKEFQESLSKQKYFVVGAGAIGCELLKNFAMIGLGASPEGKIVVTDMDHIERSNLSRQFLFRNEDVQQGPIL